MACSCGGTCRKCTTVTVYESEKKDCSGSTIGGAVVGAVIGGAVGGPIGALIGAALGGAAGNDSCESK